jgi:Cdc6-like AAA superfamily ATPase
MTASASHNPFPAQGTSSMEEHVLYSALLDWATDAPTSMLPHVQRLAGVVERYLTAGGLPTRGQAVFVSGAHGTGKTHALRYALGKVSSSEDPLQLYVKAEDDDFVFVYRHLMSQLGRPGLRDLTLRFRAVLATERAAGYADEVALIEAARRDPEKVSDLFQAMLVAPGTVLDAQAEELARIADDGADFERVLDALLDPTLEQNAYDWMVGNDIDLTTARRLGVDGPILDPSRARFGLQLLAALCSRVGRPLIIVIDQIEHLVLRSGKAHVPNIGLLHTLVERIPATNGMIILLGNPAAGDALPPDLWERFGSNIVRTEALSPSEAKDVLSAYVETGPPGTPRIDSEAFSLFLSASGGNVRRLLQIAWAVFDQIEPGQANVDRATVARAVAEIDRQPPDRKSADAFISRELRAAGLGFQRDWEAADYAVLADERPLLLVRVIDAALGAEPPETPQGLNRAAVTKRFGERVLIVTIVLGYASPRVLRKLRTDADEVIVLRGSEDLKPLRAIVERLLFPPIRRPAPSYSYKLRLILPVVVVSLIPLVLYAISLRNTSWGIAAQRSLWPFGWPAISLALLVAGALITRHWLPLGGRRYRRVLRTMTAHLETIGLRTQGEYALRAEQVVVDVRLRPRPVHETVGAGLAAVPILSDEGAPLSRFLKRGRVLALLGGPGTGKTTLLRSITHSLCVVPFFSLRPRRLPILLYLRDHVGSLLSEDPPGLFELPPSSALLDGVTPPDWIRARLERGRCVVMLDGLDEISDLGDRLRVVHWVDDQITRYPANTFLVTSRPSGYVSTPLRGADVLQLQGFTGDQISLFVHQWYNAVTRRQYGSSDARYSREIAVRRADDLLTQVRSHPALYDLASNPLLLTMIANVHRYRGALPGSRAMLYAEMCDVLLYTRQEAKNLHDVTEMNGPTKRYVIQHLGLHMMRYRLRDISADAATAAIRLPLARVSGSAVSPSVLLEEVCNSGLLVERGSGQYEFAHLTLQEYLAAQAILQDSGSLYSILLEEIGDPWWRETTLLWATMGDASPVVAACLSVGTASALALAFDAAEIAQELHPDLRGRLEEFLDPEHGGLPEDTERRRLVSGVTAMRAFRNRIRLNGVYLCAQPVDRRLFSLFLMDESAPDERVRRFRESQLEPASGLRSADVRRFTNWVNSVVDDGSVYRLPTEHELSSAARLHLPAEQRPIWITDGDHLALWTSYGVLWPHGPVLNIRSVVHGYISPAITSDARVLLAEASVRADRERLTQFDGAIREIARDWSTPGSSSHSSRFDSAIELLRIQARASDIRPGDRPVASVLEDLSKLSDVVSEGLVQDALEVIQAPSEPPGPSESGRIALAVTVLFAALLSGSGDPRRDALLARVIVRLIAADTQEPRAVASDDLIMLMCE